MLVFRLHEMSLFVIVFGNLATSTTTAQVSIKRQLTVPWLLLALSKQALSGAIAATINLKNPSEQLVTYNSML